MSRKNGTRRPTLHGLGTATENNGLEGQTFVDGGDKAICVWRRQTLQLGAQKLKKKAGRNQTIAKRTTSGLKKCPLGPVTKVSRMSRSVGDEFGGCGQGETGEESRSFVSGGSKQR